MLGFQGDNLDFSWYIKGPTERQPLSRFSPNPISGKGRPEAFKPDALLGPDALTGVSIGPQLSRGRSSPLPRPEICDRSSAAGHSAKQIEPTRRQLATLAGS
jgi:hypothetical protein